MKKIIFTGGGSAGHVTPNIALISKLRQQGWNVQYIGSAAGIEKEIIEHEGILFHSISSGKLRRYFDLKNFKDPLRVIKGVFEATALIKKIKPNVVFSKGGFVSVPVVIGSWLNRVPVIIHESDLSPGLANRLSLPFAACVCVTFPETVLQVRGGKAVCTGIPIREDMLRGNASKGLQLCNFHRQKPVLLVMGGSLGSQKINQALRESLKPLLLQFQIIHITGKGNVDSELIDKQGYKQFEYVNDGLPDLLTLADLIVSRAGSTSIFEFLALRKPMLLIPLSKLASRGDQILNAQSFENNGYAQVLYEEALNGETLQNSITALFQAREQYTAAMHKSKQANGLNAIVTTIERMASR